MKILLVNLHSSHNAGDDVLTRVTVRELRRHFSNPDLVLAMNDPESYQGYGQTVGSFMTWLKKDGRWRTLLLLPLLLLSLLALVGHRLFGQRTLSLVPAAYRPLLRAYFEAELVLSSAGNFLYSSGQVGLPFLIAIYSMAYGSLAGKPLYTMPQTIGPLRRRHEEWLVRWIAGRSRLLLVRDAISQKQLQRLGAWGDHCRLLPDVAFLMPPADRLAGEQLLCAHGADLSRQPQVGVTLINWGAQNRHFEQQEAYEAAVAAALRAFLGQHGGQASLFSQVCGPTPSEDDRIPARRVKALLADFGEQVVLIDSQCQPETLKAAYGCMDLFVGTRLHSNIFALLEGVPAVTIQYQYKTRGVLQMLGLEEWVLEIEAVNATRLTSLLEKLWAEADMVRAYLRKTMPAIVESAGRAGALIKVDYTAYEAQP